MTDIRAFIAARLDEDETAAKAATPGPWAALDGGVLSLDDDSQWPVADTESDRNREDRVHIARHDPVRVLAEVAAKREHLQMWAEAAAQRGKALDMANSTTPLMQTASIGARATANGLCDAWAKVLYLDAAVYRDHPDYDPAWKATGGRP